MRTVTYRLADLKNLTINLGFVGENEHTVFRFDCMKAFEEYPDAVPSLAVTPPNGDPYPAVTIRDGDYVEWTINDSDVAQKGNGEAQLTFIQDNVVMKDYIFRTKIDRSILPTGEAPDPIQTWIDEANEALGTISGAVDDAEEARDAAIEAKNDAVEAQGKAETAQGYAEAAKSSAEASAQSASGYADSASESATNAQESAESAAESAASIHDDADRAVQAKEDAEDARDDARTYAGNAEQSAGQASASATTATTKAGEASQSAGSASSSASTATTQAGVATTKATEAGQSATSAQTNALKAEGYAVGKQNGTDVPSTSPYYENNAKHYAESAEQSAQEAAESAASIDPDTLAHIDGYYEDMTVGNAEQLVATVGITDNAPYTFRTSGGSADIGDREVDKLIGGTVVWNQLVPANKKSGNKTPPGNATYDLYNVSNTPVKGGHVCFVSVDYTYSGERTDIRPYIQFGTGGNTAYVRGGSDKFFNVGSIGKTQRFGGFVRVLADLTMFSLGMTSTSKITSSDTWSFDNLMCIDITQMLGSTIAEYTMTLDSVDGVPWFAKLFPKPYYAYNAGELMSVKALSHDTVGFNAWDEEWELGSYNESTGEKLTGNTTIRNKNMIPVLPNTQYYFKSPWNGRMFFYNKSGEYLGVETRNGNQTFTTWSNTYYICFRSGTGTTTYNHDICINLSWDGERNGEYEPYVKRSYPLGDVELRGVPKLDANNSLYYDGDEYTDDGTVTRLYGVVDLGSVTWAISNGLFYAVLNDRFVNGVSGSGVCLMYPFYGRRTWTQLVNGLPDKQFAFTSDSAKKYITIKDSTYSDAADFKTAMSGVMLVYELATPTTETTDAFQNPQIVDDFGTEEYVDTRDVQIPVGHETVYQPNLRAKLEMSPDSPDGDGDYIVRQSNGENTYVPLVIPDELPTMPSNDGNYMLVVSVSGDTKTLSWALMS